MYRNIQKHTFCDQKYPIPNPRELRWDYAPFAALGASCLWKDFTLDFGM